MAEEQELKQEPEAGKKKPTVFALYVPGGGMLGVLPLTVLTRLEELLGKPAIEAFQVTEGASFGGLNVAAMNIRDPENPSKPKFSSKNILDLVCHHSQNFFPPIPYRQLKLTTAISAAFVQNMIDPLKPAAFVLQDINNLLDKVKEKAPEAEYHVIDEIRELTNRKWYTKRAQKKATFLCDDMSKRNPALADMTGDLFALIATRHTNGPLDIIFKAAVNESAEAAKSVAGEFRFDPETPKKVYTDLFGDARLYDSLRTIYISANNRRAREIKTFSCLKQDFFSTDPSTPSIVSEGNHKFSDLTLATTANPIAFPPHVTEDGIECDDRAHRHMPLLHYINDILKHKPEGVDLKLVILGTGWYVSKDMDKEKQYTAYAQNPLGDLGYFFEEDNAYTMSLQRKTLNEILGKDNLIEINPRLSPRNQKELREFPERDILNATRENIWKLRRRGRSFVREEDKKIKGLAFMLAENMHLLGHMNDEEYERAMTNIGSEYDTFETREPCDGICEKHRKKPDTSSGFSISSLLISIFNGKAKEQDNKKEEKNPENCPAKKCNGGPRCDW